MDKLMLYIETSVRSHWFADDSPEWREATRQFLGFCRAHRRAVGLYVSDLVLNELRRAPGRLAGDLVGLVTKHRATVLRPKDREMVAALAEAYAEHGAIPKAQQADRLHAAIATAEDMDMLVSWNYRHLVNVERRRKILAVNGLAGHSTHIEIVTPPEVFAYEIQSETD